MTTEEQQLVNEKREQIALGVHQNGRQLTRLMAMLVATFITNVGLVLPIGSPLLQFINSCVLPPSQAVHRN